MPDYQYYASVFRQARLPLAYVDLDLLDLNVQSIVERAQGKKIRIATKSVRCVDLIKRILAAHDNIEGVMCYSAEELCYLSRQGIDNLLLAYPVMQTALLDDMAQVVRTGKIVVLMVDCEAHIARANEVAEKHGICFQLCIDGDMSMTLPGLHFGVRRSPIRNTKQLELLLAQLPGFTSVRVVGFMGYEAQVAGVTDKLPGQTIKNTVIRQLKRRSINQVYQRRKMMVDRIKAACGDLILINGGGTGSLEVTAREPWVSEVTAGSGFYCSHLFDYYQQFQHLPAAGFALEVTRKPTAGIFTCAGGGYIASGASSDEKQPLPYLPENIALLPMEGAGEVQTPIQYHGDALQLGSPVFFRHSKAGELCERFNRIHLISDGNILGSAMTYRGDGQCFL